MHIALVTLFPEFFISPMKTGLMGRAVESTLLSYSTHNPREYTTNKHKKVDDRPFGGGPGMVMLPEPMAATLNDLGFAAGSPTDPKKPLIFLSPKGKPLTQKMAQRLCSCESLTLICGRYEGLDTRVEELYPIEPICVGDFILNGGEAAALCLIEAVGRLIPGFMGDEESGDEESFSQGLLEYPHYTKPVTFLEKEVPEVLRSGDHGRIATWRRQKALEVTLATRPDLFMQASLTNDDRSFLNTFTLPRIAKNLFTALVHYPVLDKWKKSTAVSLTNLDIHDIARSSYTYGLGGFHIITPIEDQQRLLSQILEHWREGRGKQSNPLRDEALQLVTGTSSLEETIECIEKECGTRPFVVGTTASKASAKTEDISFAKLRTIIANRPVLLVLGTGHGLAPKGVALCDAFLPPVRWHGTYNHLSVRAAAVIMLDRILGDWL